MPNKKKKKTRKKHIPTPIESKEHTLENLVSKLHEDLEEVRRLKNENKELRGKMKKLVINNKNLSDLVKELDVKMEEKHEEKKEMNYDFEKGGMINNKDLEREKLNIDKDKLSLSDINKQLHEIMKMLQENKE